MPRTPADRDSYADAFAGRLRALFTPRWTAGALVGFHTAHKLLVMSHSTVAYRQLGRLVARAQEMPRAEVEREYTRTFIEAVATPSTAAQHANVLQHMAGYVSRRLDAGARRELAAAIDDYRTGRLPLTVPLTLLRRHVRAQRIAYLAAQVYLAREDETIAHTRPIRSAAPAPG
jgi:uncharacterized protein YbgA (DUF1722 family)